MTCAIANVDFYLYELFKLTSLQNHFIHSLTICFVKSGKGKKIGAM